MKLLYDVENSRWYNENGESFDSENPTIPYGNAERVEIQLYAEVAGTNSGSGAVADWTKYTDFTGSGYGAILATDNNFLHWFKATLQTAVPAGELPVSTVIDIATNVGIDDIAESGNIYLYDGNGGNEAVAYASREAISGGIRFTPAAGNVLENAYAAGAQTDIPEMLYAEAPMVPEASDPANGLFVFDFLCDSTKLRNKMQYSSVERVDDCKGLELTVFQTNADNTVSIRKRFRCSSFRITGGIADIKSGVPVPVPEQNQILALLHSFIAQGIEIQGSADGETWIDYAEIEDFQALRWFRIRVKGSNSNWSDAIPLLEGPRGNGLRVDAAGPLADISTYDTESAGFTYLATDTGDIYFKNSETSGDWADPVAFKGDPGESGVLENFVLPVTSLTDGKIEVAADAAFPVAVKTAAGNIYPIEKGSLVAAQSGYTIDPAPYLAYDDAASFSGTWYIYCAGGVKGDQGPAADFSNLTAADKGVISDAALELDWTAAFAPASANVTYEATRAGILFAKGTATNASATLGVWVYKNADQSGGVYSTSVYVPDGKAAYLSIPVPKGTYFYVQAGNVTINAMSFIPFKNSIANS